MSYYKGNTGSDNHEEEISQIQADFIRAFIIRIRIAAIILGLTVIIFSVIIIKNIAYKVNVYSEAESYMAESDYYSAVDKLRLLSSSNYKDTAELINYCLARWQYDMGNIDEAYYYMNDVNLNCLSPEREPEVSEFRETVNDEYKVFIEKKQEESRAAAEKLITTGVPFVTMSESRIKDTSLGQPSDEVRHSCEQIDGKEYYTNIYDFYSEKKLLYTAWCSNGMVIQVKDYRNEKRKSYSQKADRKPSDKDDPFDANSFEHPDDFYDFYHDDFYDYSVLIKQHLKSALL